MAENKKTFVAYTEWDAIFKMLSDEEAGKLIKHLFSYVNDENPELDDRLLKLVFEPIKQQLKRDLKKYETVRQKKVEAGKKGGVKSGQKRSKQKASEANEADASNSKQNEANEPVYVDVNVNVDVNDNVLLEKETKNIPAYSEFEIYALEKEPSVSLSALKNKYDAWVENDWKDGNNSTIKNWKSKLLQTMPFIPKNVNKGKPTNFNSPVL